MYIHVDALFAFRSVFNNFVFAISCEQSAINSSQRSSSVTCWVQPTKRKQFVQINLLPVCRQLPSILSHWGSFAFTASRDVLSHFLFLRFHCSHSGCSTLRRTRQLFDTSPHRNPYTQRGCGGGRTSIVSRWCFNGAVVTNLRCSSIIISF